MTSKLVTIFSQNVFQRIFCDKAVIQFASFVKMLAVKKKIYMKKWCNDVSGHNGHELHKPHNMSAAISYI